MENKRIYTVKEVATMFHSSPNYIYELIKYGYLEALKLKSIKIPRESIELFVKKYNGYDLSDLNNIEKIIKYEKVE